MTVVFSLYFEREKALLALFAKDSWNRIP
jgi:hypothetical protein